jgi:hypothetical protein
MAGGLKACRGHTQGAHVVGCKVDSSADRSYGLEACRGHTGHVLGFVRASEVYAGRSHG